jgi:cobalt-zinc-cadmium efflux system outer membrane protein
MPFSSIRRRSLRPLGAVVLVCGAVPLASSPAWGQAAAPAGAQPQAVVVQPAAPVVAQSTVARQTEMLDAPAPTHPALKDTDVSAPAAGEGGPELPLPADLPQSLSLDDAMRIFRARGFGLLIADAAIVSAQGAERAAQYVPNPSMSLGYGRALGYDPSQVGAASPVLTTAGASTNFQVPASVCAGCSANQYTISLSDQAAIEDSVAGKRNLRIKVAHAALEATRLSRTDAERTLGFQVKSAYLQVVQTQAAYEFARDVQQAIDQVLDLNKEMYAAGKTNSGDLERIRQTALEAQQGVDSAFQSLRQAKVALAFLLGVRGRVPEFSIDKTALKFSVPAAMNSVTAEGLVRQAVQKRPDLAALGYQEERARASIDLARRQRIPDISVALQYTQTGTGQSAIQPPTLGLTFTGNLPVFYQQQGEIKQAQADFATQQLTRGQTTAQVVSDVETAYAAYLGTRTLVERMESDLLASARLAMDITKKQWLAGKAYLSDYLLARQAFIQTNVEYIGDLTNYWTAVAQLEAAVGTEFRK